MSLEELTQVILTLTLKVETLLTKVEGETIIRKRRTRNQVILPSVEKGIKKILKVGNEGDFITLKDAMNIIRTEVEDYPTAAVVNKAIQNVFKVNPRRSNSRTIFDKLLFIKPSLLDPRTASSSQATASRRVRAHVVLPDLIKEIVCRNEFESVTSKAVAIAVEKLANKRDINFTVSRHMVESYLQELFGAFPEQYGNDLVFPGLFLKEPTE